MSTHPNIPFHCGTQRMDWKEHNCEYCSTRGFATNFPTPTRVTRWTENERL